jgi:hypothetical protein
LFGCRGRLRTSTEKLAARHKKNILVVNPLPCVYPFISTPETGGLVCQFQHPTIFKNDFDSLLNLTFCCRGRSRTSTEQLVWSPKFVLLSPPPRSEGLSAYFNTLHYNFFSKGTVIMNSCQQNDLIIE